MAGPLTVLEVVAEPKPAIVPLQWPSIHNDDCQLILDWLGTELQEPSAAVKSAIGGYQRYKFLFEKNVAWTMTPEGQGALGKASEVKSVSLDFTRSFSVAQASYIALQAAKSEHHVWASRSKGAGRPPSASALFSRLSALVRSLSTSRSRMARPASSSAIASVILLRHASE